MTVHCIKLELATSGNAPHTAVNSAVVDYVDNRTPTLEDQQTDFSKKTTEAGDEYFDAIWRFQENETRDEAVTALVERMDQVGVVDWYRVTYHTCTHDGTGGDCDWDDPVEGGTVPQWLDEGDTV